MYKTSLIIALLATALLACNSSNTSEATTDHVAKPGQQYFGDKINDNDAIPYTAMLTQMAEKDSFPAKVRGRVAEVCQVKGCWMNITAEGKEDMFVKFKDYGFFMPLDCSGKEVIMDGYAFRETTSVEELRHYASDEGKSAEEIAAITEPVEELKFLASGIILLDEAVE